MVDEIVPIKHNNNYANTLELNITLCFTKECIRYPKRS